MADDLARSLIDAAAEAIAALNPMSTDPPIAGEPAAYVDDARAAVAAVLETLADTARYSEDCGMEVWHPPGLRGLAAEIREGR